MNGSESSILSLASMLDPTKNQPAPSRTKSTPPPSTASTAKSSTSSAKPHKSPQKDIWDEDEIDYTPTDADPRPEAEYKITYRQRVSSEDIYLNMSGRLPSITDSDDLVLSIHMPGVKTAAELELTCEKDRVDVRCDK
ncbi:Protein pih1d3 [Rhizophlyctis rosea]|uniref:Protein pih1d3 n=1 Tax=Rhizophlyctis rosea TaxID=64517 RepID=A0AAD5SHL4_9FUNG|nr:Protein pih1d3 [Rhizophlyctis rosea]